MEKGNISKTLAEFCCNIKFEDIPFASADKMKKHILDTLGAGIAGSLADESAKLLRVLEKYESSGNVPIWATGRQVSARNAALANGMACHTFELDDTGGCDHSGAVVIPAMLACINLCKGKVSGKEFVTAAVLGYDIARRALEACGAYEPHNEAGWHSTSTCGVFGAAAAVGYLMKLPFDQMRSAIGLAASMSCGLWGFIHDGAQSKKLHPGRAAEGGLLAALLAKEEFRGPTMIFDDVWGGFTSTFAPKSTDMDAWTRELGSNWKINRVSIKPYASCRSTHSSIDAVDIIMKENSLTKFDIDTVTVRLNPFVNGMCGGSDRSKLSGTQMSIPYGVAARIVYGSAGLASYTEEKRLSSEVTDMLQHITLEIDEKMKSDDEPYVSLKTIKGHSYGMCVEMPLGSPTNPVKDNDLIKKYRDLALMVWKEEIADKLSDIILNLDLINDTTEISKLLATPPISSKQLK